MSRHRRNDPCANTPHHHHVITVEEPDQDDAKDILSTSTAIRPTTIVTAGSISMSHHTARVDNQHQQPSPIPGSLDHHECSGDDDEEDEDDDNKPWVPNGESTVHAASNHRDMLDQQQRLHHCGRRRDQQQQDEQVDGHGRGVHVPMQHQQDYNVEISSITEKTLDTDDDSRLLARQGGPSYSHHYHPTLSLTTTLSNNDLHHHNVDDNLLSRAIRDAGQMAVGTTLIELWVLSKDKTKLMRPPGGWWVNPNFYSYQDYENDNENETSLPSPLRQLFDPNCSTYQEPIPVPPGVGLAGVLWSDVKHVVMAHRQSHSTTNMLAAAAAHVLDRSRNRGGGSQHDGSVNDSRHSASVTNSRHRAALFQGVLNTVLDRSRHRGSAVGDDTTNTNAATAVFDEFTDIPTELPLQHQQHQQQYHYHQNRPVAYRDLESLATDPDQPYHKRVELMVRCGLTSAAAVAFDVRDGHQGIVIFIKQSPKHHHPSHYQCSKQHLAQHHVDAWRKFQSPVNEAYWRAATDMIGAVYAMSGPRRAMVAQRREEMNKVLRRVRTKLLCLRFMGIDLSNLARPPLYSTAPSFLPPDRLQSSSTSSRSDSCSDGVIESTTTTAKRLVKCCTTIICNNSITEKTFNVYHKCCGGNVPPPPPFTWEQTMWTFFGVLATLLMLTRLNVYLEQNYGNDFQIVLGPFGALMTLLYGLTAAPASQPRNVIMGQTISLGISVSIAYTHGWLPLYARQGLATAIAVAAMVKLGITHPPAGASALLFSSGDYGWMNVGFMLVGNIMAVIASTIINNMSDKRQYPIYWGLGPILDLLQKPKATTREKKK